MKKEIKKIDWKSIGIEKIILIAAAGIFLLVSDVSLWGGSHTQKGKGTEKESCVQETVLEQRLKKILEQVEGVGKTDVMIQLTNHEKEQISYLGKEQEEEVAGVIILCEGADKNQIREEVTEAASALFSISCHHIKVLKMEESQ